MWSCILGQNITLFGLRTSKKPVASIHVTCIHNENNRWSIYIAILAYQTMCHLFFDLRQFYLWPSTSILWLIFLHWRCLTMSNTISQIPDITWPSVVTNPWEGAHPCYPAHWAHDVIATLNQRQRRWFNVTITSCAQWDMQGKTTPWPRNSTFDIRDISHV